MQSNITLHIQPDYDSLSLTAARLFARAVRLRPTGAFGFATGSTPEGMYAELVKMSTKGEVDMSQITTFNLDEYVGLSSDNPQSYEYFMAKNLFNNVGVPLKNRNIPSGTTTNPVEECIAYEKKIAESGGIDLQILGIGNNGHIGFNEPAEIFAAQTAHVPLAPETIQANARFFDNPEQVPKYALSMGIQTIMMSKAILLLASGDHKAGILYDALKGPITPKIPASALQLHRNVVVVTDKAAGKFL